MPTILEPPELLAAATSLEPERFEKFVNDLLHVRARRTARTLRPEESALLAQINAGPTAEVWSEYRHLRERHRHATLTPSEHAELLRLSDEVERYQAERLAALSELAARRGQSLLE